MQFAWDDANRNHWENAGASQSLNFNRTPNRLRCCAQGPHKPTQTHRPACPSSAFLWDPCIPAASPAYFHEYDKHGQAACWWRECGVTKANLGNVRTCEFMLIMRRTQLAAMWLKVVRVCRLCVSQQHQGASYLQRHCLCDQRRRLSCDFVKVVLAHIIWGHTFAVGSTPFAESINIQLVSFQQSKHSKGGLGGRPGHRAVPMRSPMPPVFGQVFIRRRNLLCQALQRIKFVTSFQGGIARFFDPLKISPARLNLSLHFFLKALQLHWLWPTRDLVRR